MWISRRWEMIPVASFMRVKAETSHSEGLNFLLLCRVQQLRVQSGFVANVGSMWSHCRIKDSTVFTQVRLVFSLQPWNLSESDLAWASAWLAWTMLLENLSPKCEIYSNFFQPLIQAQKGCLSWSEINWHCFKGTIKWNPYVLNVLVSRQCHPNVF